MSAGVFCCGHIKPDILLVDEVLAVGDKEFQIKCYQKIQEIKKGGTTIILVSHSEYTIRETTSNCVYLSNGKMRFSGSSDEGISVYLRDTLEHRAMKLKSEKPENSLLMRKAEILNLKFYDHGWNEVSFVESGQELNIVMECDLREKLEKPIFGVNFYDNAGFMYCANSDYENVTFDKLPLSRVNVKINIPAFHLPHNSYLCSAVIAEESADNLMDWHDMTYRLVVGRAKNARGSIKLPTKWEVDILE